MLRVTSLHFAAALAFLALAAAPAFSSPASEKGLHELQTKVRRTESALTHATTLKAKVALVKNLRLYVARELDKQRALTQPDATDDQLALELIGFDEDLGSFIDEPSPNFSEAQCSGERISMIHSYTPAGETRAPANLPLHTQESLDILNLLCGS